MKLIELHRDEDETGVSGTGKVAQGVVFDNGKVALTWLTEHTSVAIYDNVEDVVTIHGHGGKTRVLQVADIDVDAGARAYVMAYMDDMENIGVEFTTPNHKYMWKERDKLADMFRPVTLNPAGVKHG